MRRILRDGVYVSIARAYVLNLREAWGFKPLVAPHARAERAYSPRREIVDTRPSDDGAELDVLECGHERPSTQSKAFLRFRYCTECSVAGLKKA